MDGQVNEHDLEGAAFLCEHQSLLRRYQEAAKRARDAEQGRAKTETRALELAARQEQALAQLEQAGQRITRLGERIPQLVARVDELTAINDRLLGQLNRANELNSELTGRLEEAKRLHAEAMRLIKEEALGAARENLRQAAAPAVSPEHGRHAAKFVAVAARVAASMAPPEYRTHLTDVADGAARVVAQPTDRVWSAWAGEAGRFGRKFTGAPEPDDGPRVRVDGSYEAAASPQPANDRPRYEHAVIVPLGDGRVRVQVVGKTDGRPAVGFGIVLGEELRDARLGVDGLLVLLPRRGTGTSAARELLRVLAALDPQVSISGSTEMIRQKLDLHATPATINAALERVAAISCAVLFDPLRSTWHVERILLEKLNLDGETLEIEIVRQAG